MLLCIALNTKQTKNRQRSKVSLKGSSHSTNREKIASPCKHRWLVKAVNDHSQQLASSEESEHWDVPSHCSLELIHDNFFVFPREHLNWVSASHKSTAHNNLLSTNSYNFLYLISYKTASECFAYNLSVTTGNTWKLVKARLWKTIASYPRPSASEPSQSWNRQA